MAAVPAPSSSKTHTIFMETLSSGGRAISGTGNAQEQDGGDQVASTERDSIDPRAGHRQNGSRLVVCKALTATDPAPEPLRTRTKIILRKAFALLSLQRIRARYLKAKGKQAENWASKTLDIFSNISCHR